VEARFEILGTLIRNASLGRTSQPPVPGSPELIIAAAPKSHSQAYKRHARCRGLHLKGCGFGHTNSGRQHKFKEIEFLLGIQDRIIIKIPKIHSVIYRALCGASMKISGYCVYGDALGKGTAHNFYPTGSATLLSGSLGAVPSSPKTDFRRSLISQRRPYEFFADSLFGFPSFVHGFASAGLERPSPVRTR
jgi:hypothetical protein